MLNEKISSKKLRLGSGRTLLLLAGLLILGFALLWPGSGQGVSGWVPKGEENMFPTVTGKNLDREAVTFPRDFEGDYNLVFIAFQQWQQNSINTWIPFSQDLEGKCSDFRYYELPVIQELNWFSRTFINEGMRLGIPDPKARVRTITLYLEKESFRDELALPDEEQIYLLLVDRAGEILWQERGSFTPKKAEALRGFLSQAEG